VIFFDSGVIGIKPVVGKIDLFLNYLIDIIILVKEKYAIVKEYFTYEKKCEYSSIQVVSRLKFVYKCISLKY